MANIADLIANRNQELEDFKQKKSSRKNRRSAQRPMSGVTRR